MAPPTWAGFGRRHQLWLSGRYDSEVYVFDTATGQLIKRIPVDPGPHGLAVWPQPGRYTLGHTGNTRLPQAACRSPKKPTILARRPSASTVTTSVPVTAIVPSGATRAQP